MVLAASATVALLAASPAFAVTLTNGVGDGQVTVAVTGGGEFGSASPAGGPTLYNPVGAIPPANAVYDATNYLRIGPVGQRTAIGSLPSQFGSVGPTETTSTFNSSGLNFALTQTLQNTETGGVQTGSLLTQTYVITNTTGGALDFELLRYVDGDLLFDGSRADGGGALISGGNRVLFETDSATGASDNATFLGIYSTGGTDLGYLIDNFGTVGGIIQSGSTLLNTIAGDGDHDGFIDAGAGYDVALGLGRGFSLGAGQSTTYTTYTIFGSGLPSDVVVAPPVGGVPEPSAWALMLVGFGGLGAALRRRRTSSALAAA